MRHSIGKSNDSDFRACVGKVRAFNRFYTKQIGLLNEGLYGSRFSLTEVRVLQEVWRRKQTTATAIRKELALDAGYLSRMLQRFEKQRLIRRNPSKLDKRQSLVSLTAHGHRTFLPLEIRARAETAALLKKISPLKQERLVRAMREVQEIVGGTDEDSASASQQGLPLRNAAESEATAIRD